MSITESSYVKRRVNTEGLLKRTSKKNMLNQFLADSGLTMEEFSHKCNGVGVDEAKRMHAEAVKRLEACLDCPGVYKIQLDLIGQIDSIDKIPKLTRKLRKNQFIIVTKKKFKPTIGNFNAIDKDYIRDVADTYKKDLLDIWEERRIEERTRQRCKEILDKPLKLQKKRRKKKQEEKEINDCFNLSFEEVLQQEKRNLPLHKVRDKQLPVHII